MTRPNIPAALSFDSRGINNSSAEYCPRLFTITPGRTNDPQTQALGHAFAAVPALLEALEHALPGLESAPPSSPPDTNFNTYNFPIMQTQLQKELAKIAPNICIETIWTEDPDSWSEWRELSKPGNCFDGEDRDDWQPWQSQIRATCICNGRTCVGSDYLGGTWEKSGDNPAVSNPEISGYERQMTEGALRELGEQITNEMLSTQIINALKHLSNLN